MIEFIQKADILGWSVNGETVEIQAWGRSGIRVRATRLPQIKPDWISALLPLEQSTARVEFDQHGAARMQNGSLVARVSPVGEISFLDANSGNELLQEKPIHALSIRPGRIKISKAIYSTLNAALNLMKANTFSAWANTCTAGWTKKAVSSSSSNATLR